MSFRGPPTTLTLPDGASLSFNAAGGVTFSTPDGKSATYTAAEWGEIERRANVNTSSSSSADLFADAAKITASLIV